MVSDSRLVGYFPSVVADQVQGTRDAVQHLLQLGHKTVHHITGDFDSQPAVVRSATWQKVLEEAGIRAPKAWPGDWSARSGYEAGRQIAEDPSITAVYCGNDEIAFGLMRALHERGRRVPDDVSIVGFDAVALGEYSSPPLTTVRQDFARVGEELVRLLLELIQGGAPAARDPIVIPTELLIRGSTAAPPV